MAASDVEIKFLGNLEGIKVSITQMSELLRGLVNPIQGVRSQLGEIAEAFAAAFAIEKINEFARSMGEMGEQIEKTAMQLGVSTTEVQQLDYIAKSSGSSVEALAAEFSRFSMSMGEQSDRTARGLRTLGLTFKDFAGRDTMASLELLAERFSQLEDGAAKNAAGMSVLGRQFREMLPFLNQGSEGIRRLKEESEAIRAIIPAEAVESLAEMHHQFVMLDAAVRGATVAGFLPFRGAVEGVVAIVRDLATDFTEAMTEGGALASVLGLLAAAIKVIVTAAAAVIQTFKNVWAAGTLMVTEIERGTQSLATVFAEVDKAILASWSALWAAMIETARIVGSTLITQFNDLGAAASAAFHFDLSGARAAMDDFGRHGEDATKKITTGWKEVAGAMDMRGASAAMDKFRTESGAAWDTYNKTLLSNNKHFADEYARLWGETHKKEEESRKAAQFEAPDKNARDRVAAAMKAIDGEIKAEQAGLEQKKAIYGIEASTHQIRESERIEKVRAATDAEYAAEMALLRQELDIQGMKLAQRQEVENKITALENKHRLDEITLDKEAIAERQKTWEGYFGAVQGAFNGQLRGLLAGTTSFRTAMKSIFGDLIISVIQGIEKMVFEWIAGQIGMTAATTAGVATRTSAETAGSTAGILSMITNALKAIGSGVAATIAGVSGAVAPIAGPAAPAAGIAAGAAVEAAAMGVMPALEIGAWRIGGVSPALLHPGEMVLPGPSAEMMRNALVGGGSGGGGDTHLHFPGVMDTRGFIQAISNHSSPIARIIGKAMTRNPSTRPAY